MYHEYPKTMYHESGVGKLVYSREEEAQCGAGWSTVPQPEAFPEHYPSGVPVVESEESYQASEAILEQSNAVAEVKELVEEQYAEPEAEPISKKRGRKGK